MFEKIRRLRETPVTTLIVALKSRIIKTSATSRELRCVDCGRSLESGVSYSEIAFLRLTHPDIKGEGLLCFDCLDIREGK